MRRSLPAAAALLAGTLALAAGESPPPAPSATPTFAQKADMRWEGMVRRNSGVVLLRSRWDLGVLEFRGETLRWTDLRDAGKNLLIPGRQIQSHFLSCRKKPGGGECPEWGFRTKESEFRFRDAGGESGESPKPRAIFTFMQAIYPDVPATESAEPK